MHREDAALKFIQLSDALLRIRLKYFMLALHTAMTVKLGLDSNYPNKISSVAHKNLLRFSI